MALTRRFVERPPRFLQQCFSFCPSTTARTFVTVRTPPTPLKAHLSQNLLSLAHPARRAFASSTRCRITGQEAPSAQAYISSGILGGNKNLVDVKKVLVIGSGGLSIGQAGEFDYSGKS